MNPKEPTSRIPRVLVIGDAMRDVYHIGDATRISPEAPVPVVRIYATAHAPGGASNVVENLEVLGARTELICGYDPDSKIPHKHRLMVGSHQLARWDENDRVASVDPRTVKAIVGRFRPEAVVISDYGKGSITDPVIEAIAKLELPTFIDTKHNPKAFVKIKDRTYFPNQMEFMGYKDEYAEQPKIVRKLGKDGMQLWENGVLKAGLPAWQSTVVSVCGAGDTVLAAYAYATLHGLPALSFANAAAAVVVGKPTTATASEVEVLELLKGVE